MRKTKQEGVSKFSPISQYLRANGWTKEADSFDAVNEAAARIATLEATLARKQRAIDAAMSARRSGMNAGPIADILRPEATDAKLNEAGVTYTPTKPQPDQPDTGFGTHVVPEYKPSAQPEPSGDSIAKRVDALERLTQELASAHCATFPPDQRIVGLVKRLADPVLRCCLQLNNEYKARDFVGTHAERSLLCNAIDECQAIIAELSAAEARLFSMRLPFHPKANREDPLRGLRANVGDSSMSRLPDGFRMSDPLAPWNDPDDDDTTPREPDYDENYDRAAEEDA